MTPDQIMHLANACAGQHWMDEAHIQRFAALVAEAEREACASVCDRKVDAEYATGKVDHNEIAWTKLCAIDIRAREETK